MSTEPARQADADLCARGDAALARAFVFLGKRWNGVVLGNLSTGPAGFRELGRSMAESATRCSPSALPT